jgi:hypothetical protein
MSKIVFVLSGARDVDIAALAGADDLIVCAPGVQVAAGRALVELAGDIKPHERSVTDGLVQIHALGQADPAAALVECFLNDYYSYSLRPLAAIMLGLQQQLARTGVTQVLVVTAKPGGARMPMVGFQTTESARGSRSLLNSRIAALLPGVFPGIVFNYHYVAGDLLCREPARRAVIGAANLVFSGLLALKTIGFGWRAPAVTAARARHIVLVRTEHQMRFAQRLFAGARAAGVAIFAQASQGSFKSLLALRAGVPAHVSVERVGPGMVLRAALATFADGRRLKRYAANRQTALISVNGLGIPVRLADIADEIRLVSVAVFYKNIVAQMLARSAAVRLINFELVGRMAGLEALAARESGIDVVSVQSALISASPHPVFPYSARFYSDSATTCDMIAANGSRRNGAVVYQGPPYPLKAVKAVSALHSVAFFTQPHEAEVSLAIVAVLCRWARARAVRITLRLHPRDVRTRYDALLGEYADVLHLELAKGLVEIIESHQLSITRTSSVAKEAVAMGSAILLCLWSGFDRSIKADYIVDEPGVRYCARSEAELLTLLDDPAALSASAASINQRMFGGMAPADLSASLFA